MGIIVKEVKKMPYLTKEEIAEAMKQKVTLTSEEKEKAKAIEEKMKTLSYDECRAIRMKEDEENGFM